MSGIITELTHDVKSAKKELDLTREQRDGRVREKLARIFSLFYFWILVLIIVGIPVYNIFAYNAFRDVAMIISLKDTILTYSAVTGPTLGLVVAYYFQSKRDR